MTVRAYAIGSALILAACSVGPNFRRPAVPKATQYVAGASPTATVSASGVAQRFVVSGRIGADWWRMFRSQSIAAAVERAIANNQSLAAARASLRRSHDVVQAGYGVFYPQLDAQLGASYQRASPLRYGQRGPATDFALYSAGASVSYALDLWGGERRQLEALRAQAEAQRYTLASARVMLCGNVVDALIARAAYFAQLDATRETLALENEQLRITKAQAAAGAAPYANVLSIKALISSTAALVPQLELRADQADHLLAALVGEAASAWRAPDVPLEDITLPADLPVSLPAQLVRQRADVLIAEAQLHAANAQIGVATAAMLPNITLSASGGANNLSLPNLFADNGLFGSLGGSLLAPLFHGQTLSFQRRAAIDAHDQALASYRETVLTAFQQVADSLRSLQHDAELLQAENEAVDAASQALRLLQANYQAGTANYLQVIVASEQYVQAKTSQVQATAQRLQDTVALYVAIGGGYWNAKSL